MDANERTIPKLGFSAQEVADAIGVARSFLYEMNKTGELGPQAARLGNLRIWSAVEVHLWMLHGMPSRGRWVELWPSIRSTAQESIGIGLHGPGGWQSKGRPVSCGRRA